MTYERETGRGGIEDYFNKTARKHHCFNRKLKWGCRNGAPDRFITFPDGRCYFVELKSPGKKPDPHQLREHARMMGYGLRVYTLDSRPAIDAFFKEHANDAG
ncbi:MAG: VRR-NUC domain-containing protein [Pantoea ananatis]|nr:VRR-NUC domain-containing protein [Pantoea ananatis]